MNYSEELTHFGKILGEASPIFGSIVERQKTKLGPEWVKEFVDDLYLLFGPPKDGAWEKAAWGYIEFCLDASKSQHYFEKHGKYKNSNFAQIQQTNYDNESFMLENYLPGMVISHYLWAHHYVMGKVYREKLMPIVKERVNPKVFLEGGTGSAVYTLHTLRSLPGVKGLGYDISPHAISFGKRLLSEAGYAKDCEMVQKDVLKSPPDESVDFVLSQEVLEHLEDPSTFVANLHRVLKPGGMGFITGAVTAAHSDHIYLFRTPEDVFDMLRTNGFKIVEPIVEYADDDKPDEVRPKIAGALVAKE